MLLPSFSGIPLVLILLPLLSSVHAGDTVSTDSNTYGANSQSPYQTFISAPELKPPEILVTKNVGGLADGYLFIGLDGKPDSTQNVPCIYDMSPGPRLATLVWTGIDYKQPFDFKVQTYKGEPHLTFFLGELLDGYGHGSFYLLNASYVEVARFDAIGYPGRGDLHELLITSDDHALVIVYTPRQVDLTEFGGASDGWIFENIFQEINIDTNEVVFSWNASNYVAVDETYNTIANVGTEAAPFDYFHINSVDKDANGDYLVSARVTNCIYKISGKDGSIIWRLGGKRTDFKLDPAAEFAYQHDARWFGDEKQDHITLFDNGPHGDISYSRGMLLAVDQDAKTVSLVTEFRNGPSTFGQFEGNLQPINPGDPNTNFIVGFGLEPYFTEFSSNGTVLLDVQFATATVVNNYRTYKLPWQGKPLDNPSIHWASGTGKVHLSWNGATDHENWILYTADTANATTWTNISAPITRTGFETEIDISAANPSLLRAIAVNADGKKLGWTDAVDSNGNYFQVPDVDESQVVTSDDHSSVTGVRTAPTPTVSVNSTTGASATALTPSTPSGGASNAMIPPLIVLEILAAAVTFAGFRSI